MRKFNKAKDAPVHHKIKKALIKLANGAMVDHIIWQRANIILDVLKGIIDIEVALLYDVSRNLVMRWRNRFLDALPDLNHIAQKKPEILAMKVQSVLSDNMRSGRPPVFNAVSRSFIIGIACNNPIDYGFVRSHWSLPILRKAIIGKEIVSSISCSTINRILSEVELKPHKNRYWLHSAEKGENPFTYKQKIQEINGIYFTAAMINQFGRNSDLRIISTDEMTGIQALEHKYPDKPARPHMSAKTEFEYIRHGTTSLIGFFDIVTGKLECPYLNKTRTADDFVNALSMLINTDQDKHWIIVADNLNTHYSEQLVRYVADRCDISQTDLKGALRNTKSRIEFLMDSSHRIRFAFTPKHCSWMNQIEIWFGIINRHLLRRKSFLSLEDLKDSILSYIDQYNTMFAHPFEWKYHTTPLGSNLLLPTC